MFFTAEDRAQHLVVTGLCWYRQRKFLCPWFQRQVPTRDQGAVFADEGKPVDRTIARPTLALARRDAQDQLLAGLCGNLRIALAGDLKGTVLVSHDLNDPRLAERGQPKEEEKPGQEKTLLEARPMVLDPYRHVTPSCS